MKQVVVALAATLAVQALLSFAALAIPVIAPRVAADLGVEPHLVGGFVSIVYGMAAVSGLVSGGLIGRFGPLRVSQVALVISATGMILAALGALPAIVACAVLAGMALGPATPASSQILARDSPPGQMNLIFSIKQTGVPVGNLLAGAIVPSLSLALGWHAALLCIAAACLGLAIALQPLRSKFDLDRHPNRPFFSGAQIIGPLRLVLADAALRRLALCAFVFSGMQISATAFLVAYLAHDLDMTLVLAGFILAVAQASGVVGRIAWGVVADRHAEPQLVLGALGLGMTLLAALAAAFTPAWPIPVVVLVCVAWGATAIGWNGVYLAQVARLSPPGRTAEVTGGTFFIMFGGVMIVPTAFATIVGATDSYGVAYLTMATMALIASVAFLRHRA
ncbi:MAG: MFS transporter [Proteobacteria bacterium]|nr:MFS transporter [Pseudomonadota bacterium]